MILTATYAKYTRDPGGEPPEPGMGKEAGKIEATPFKNRKDRLRSQNSPRTDPFMTRLQSAASPDLSNRLIRDRMLLRFWSECGYEGTGGDWLWIMWPFKQKERIPFFMVIETGLRNMVSASPFLDNDTLSQIGDRRVLGDDVLRRLPAEVIYASSFLVIHFCLTRPYGLKKTFDRNSVGNTVQKAIRGAFNLAPDSLGTQEEVFVARYEYYLAVTKVENPKGEADTMARAFAWVTLRVDDRAPETPGLNSKLGYLLILGNVIFETTEDIMSGLLRNKELF
jgi:hypothetical protein